MNHCDNEVLLCTWYFTQMHLVSTQRVPIQKSTQNSCIFLLLGHKDKAYDKPIVQTSSLLVPGKTIEPEPSSSLKIFCVTVVDSLLPCPVSMTAASK